jgi:uncharacterized protein YgbK (DUF1537 family)
MGLANPICTCQVAANVERCRDEADPVGLAKGDLLGHWVPLHKTGAAVDPREPVNTSCAQRLFEEQSRYLINHSLAEMTYQILKQNAAFQGIYTSGGDITVAVSKKFKTVGIRLLDEVVPLAAYGELIAGEFDGLKIVTKGGMVGDRNAMKDCIRYLKERLYL